ncbi:spermidine hydroxycinnamoyl transferase-like [Humulus lupulus]|uniref:spermidine hydroxycinnamoyl transferase-like n=1 Tax=Humulus lupulus TaxID=3486 RepID=UPI002B411B47|nr:spermidine hydroxycinnamoyl transferase-like [Humulus lupulus]
MVTLKLANEQVQKLKKRANQDRQISTTLETSRPYTRYEVLTAHIWRCSTKARKHQREQPTACAITIDSRKRLQSPLPFSYFGNGVFYIMASCTSGDLLSKSLGFGASKVRLAIESTNGGGKYYGNPNVGVINWMNLPFEGIDFGWGKEIHFGPAYHKVDGDLWILRSGDEDESLLIVICLLVEHVKAFKKYFFDDI